MRPRRSPGRARILGVGLALALAATSEALVAQAEDGVSEVIRQHVEQIRIVGHLVIDSAEVASKIVLPRIYERRNFAPLWTDSDAVRDLFRAIDDAALDGLDPDDYHRQALRDRRRRLDPVTPDPGRVGEYDILLTDALVRLGYHILFGKVDPERLDPNWNLAGELDGLSPVDAIEGAVASGRLHEVIEGYKPRDPFYVELKDALGRYRAIAARGGWDPVPPISRLALDSVDARVRDLRRRLRVTGDLPPSASVDVEIFDEDLDQAVRAFQRRHGLTADGVVGRNTVAALNVPVEARIDQIRVNLERCRWVLRELVDDFVLVNIAGFRVYLVEDRRAVWSSRVVVGTTYDATPLFRAEMTYLVLNPTWTVPPGIIRSETLPALERDPGYLARNHMKLLDLAGNGVDPATVDFSRYVGRTFPYVVRQDPGPWNALGRVKFVFPNEHSVYLHDTPSRNLFEREVRTFSHGCIRVEHPLELAERLLRHQPGWNRGAIDRQVASGESRTVYLDEPLPTLILYWTAWVDPEAGLTFYPDVYGRDTAVMAGLNAPFTFRIRPVVREGAD